MNKINKIIAKGSAKENPKESKLIELIENLIDTYRNLQNEFSHDINETIYRINCLFDETKDFYISSKLQNTIEEAVRNELKKIKDEATQIFKDLVDYAKQEFDLNLKEVFKLIEEYNNDYIWIEFNDFANYAHGLGLLHYDEINSFINDFENESFRC